MTVRFVRCVLAPLALALLAGTGFIAGARSQEGHLPPRPAVSKGPASASRTYPFADGTEYAVRASPGRVTDIALEPGEALGAVASGDTARWIIGHTTSGSADAVRAHVLIKPTAAGLSTNLIITTDRRVYYLMVTSDAEGAMSSVTWSYPQDALIALKREEAAARAAAPVASEIALGELRFDYVIIGDEPSWRPLRVFDDGRQTFIQFPASIAVGEAPPLFLVGEAGEAELVNYRMRGRYYVVDRLFDLAELRLGTESQEVVRIRRIGDEEHAGHERRRP